MSDANESSDISLLGPANSVMQTIFETVGVEEDPETPTEAAGTDGIGVQTEAAEGVATPEAGSEPDPQAAGAGESGAGGSSLPAGSGGAEGGAAGGAVEPTPAPVITADLETKFDAVAEALDQRFLGAYQEQAIQEAQEDYGHYIEKLDMHPMELVGQPLPAIDGSGQELVFRSTAEVKEWQEAVVAILKRGMAERIEALAGESNEVYETVHASIEMFRSNPDLIPNTPGFNPALANEVMRMVRPYALHMDGKLTGFSIPVQGLIDEVRAGHKVRSLANKPAPAPAPAKKPRAATPQGGIKSAAGSSGEDSEDYTPMWNALGISQMPI